MNLRWPGRITAETVSDAVWAHWDFLPTAAEIAGASSPEDIDGISFLPTLSGHEQKRTHEFLYWESHEGIRPGGAPRIVEGRAEEPG
jgi:arylsulfatase A-like enzyme